MGRPKAIWYGAHDARRQASSAKGSVWKSTSAAVKDPGDAHSREVYAEATQRRRASGLSRMAARITSIGASVVVRRSARWRAVTNL